MLQLIRPKLEAYHEYITRQATSKWTEERAYDVILKATDDEQLAGDTVAQIAFSQKLPKDET